MVLLSVFPVMLGVAMAGTYLSHLPDRDQLRDILPRDQITFEMAVDGRPRPVCHCAVPVPAEEIPRHLRDALIAIEDRRFLSHHGIDWLGIGRAVVHGLTTGRLSQGGSTITQQLVKNTILSPRRSLLRKLAEMVLAWRVETAFTKEEIVVLFLNRVPFASTPRGPIVGIERAARHFFGKRARDLTLYESALLVGMLQATSALNLDRNPDGAHARARLVLDAMVREAMTTREAADLAQHTGIQRGRLAPLEVDARHFAAWIAEQVPGLAPRGQDLADLRVFVTLDARAQALAGQAAGRLATSLATRAVSEVALVTIGTDGAVRAMVGGRGYGASQFNRVTQARRQPGSAFKPFIFLAALEAGRSATSRVLDAPFAEDAWAPRNFGQYRGMITLREALAHSANTATVRLADSIGVDRVVAVARRLGITSPLRPTRSLALGTSEVTLIEMTGAFAAFANGGHAITPYGIAAIASRNGLFMVVRRPAPMRPAIAAQHLGELQAMMRSVVTIGTGTAANVTSDAAGKTGTTQDHRDAWFIGYAGDAVTGMWVGNDDFSPTNGVTGGEVAAAWGRYMVAHARLGSSAQVGLARHPSQQARERRQ